MHSYLNYIAAQQHIVALRAAAEPSRRPADDRLLLTDSRRSTIRPIERYDLDPDVGKSGLVGRLQSVQRGPL